MAPTKKSATPAKSATAKKASAKPAFPQHKPAPRKPATATQPASSPLFHSLSALLHTVRLIAGHEDSLCILTHEAKHNPTLSAESLAELHDLLDHLPHHHYAADIEAVRKAVDIAE